MDLTANSGADSLTLDDLAVGQVFHSGLHHVDAAQIKSFASDFDPQPFHLDEESAEKTMFGGLAASGWMTAAITMRLLVSSVPIVGGVVGAEVEIKWPRPTRPGDTLRVESEVLEIIPSRSHPDRGMVIVRSITINQEGHPVQILVSKLVVPRKSRKDHVE